MLEGLPPLGGAPSSLSFPSAHALSSFAVATAMFRVDPATAGALVVALAISLCRPYLGMHYPSDVLAGALLGVVLGLIVPLSLMKVGIVGLPNAGKSTLFNALTKGGAQTGDYPFTTIEPNVAVAQVPDERLEKVAETVRSSELVPATIDFHDIAGLVKGASEGEGLGNQFLASIRETDAICHVVRCHEDSGVPHPDGRVDPLADIETIETELVLADYEQVERRLRPGRQAGASPATRRRSPSATGCRRSSRRSPPAARPARCRFPRPRPTRLAQPAGADHEADPLRRQRRRGRRRGAARRSPPTPPRSAPGWSRSAPGSRASWPSSTPSEAEEMRESYGVEGSGLARLVRAAYDLLDLITFFTAGEDKEAVARPLRRGATAWRRRARSTPRSWKPSSKPRRSAGRSWSSAAATSPARDKGLLRIEGRDYVVQDGDVITIKV